LDLKFSSSGDSDSSYNLSFESKASKHKNSYHVELKIPFAVLQFNKADEMKWNVLLYRSTYTDENRSQNINFPIDLNNPCLPCQTKSNITLKNIESKNRVSLLPFVFGGLSGFQENENLSYEKPFGDVGLSGLFDLNNTTSLEYAINPDFSQVEADVSQITANNTFAVFFEERRAYFNEGNDIIDTRLNTVYTRSINKPTFSSKLITQGEKQRIYWLAAYDEASPYLIAGENRSYFGKGGASFSNVFRYQRTFDRGSNIGFLTTNRFFKEGGSGNTIGVDGIYRFKESYTASFEFNKSITQEPIENWIDENEQIKDKNTLLDGEESQGDAFYFSIQRNTKNWNSEIEYEQYSPHYQTPIGFVTQNSIRFLSVNHGYQYFFNKKNYVKQLGLYLGSIISYNYENLLKYQEIGTSIDLQLSGNIETGIEYNFIISEEFEGFNGTNMNDLEFFISYNPSERVSLRLFTNVGESIVYNEENPATGNNLFIGTFNSFQITPQLTISPSFRYSQLKNKSDDSFYFRGYIARTEINYQFNNTLSFRLIGEFNEFEENFFYQPLLKWNPNPFTIFYIGGTNGYSILNTNNKYGIENSQLYFKFQYQFDL
jgi:hypothetical protein